MKRFAVLVLSLMLVLSFCPTLYAATGELLMNSDFSNGPTSWINSASALSVTSGVAKVTNRTANYSSCKQNITELLYANGKGTYQLGCKLKRVSPGPTVKAFAVICISDDDGRHWCTSPQVSVTANDFITTSGSVKIQWNGILSNAEIYFQTTESGTFADMYADDFSLKKTSAVTPVEGYKAYFYTDSELGSAGKAVRDGSAATFGVSRWDAWYGHDGKNKSVISQVEATLSPAKYHFRAPFFSTVTAQNTIEVDAYTQAVFDKEMEYAASAGIDYFAYLWYSDEMKAARRYYKTSKYAGIVKICVILSSSTCTNHLVYAEVEEMMASGNYMTVCGGRPLLFYYCTSSDQMNQYKESILVYRKICTDQGKPWPYVVLMGASTSFAYGANADAVSRYAISCGENKAFSDLVNSAKGLWSSLSTPMLDVVPPLTAGWQNMPRYETPVTWTDVKNKSYAAEPTKAELTAEVTDGYRFLGDSANASATAANTMLMYSWNEHDEGGWVCPTIEVDGNGNQLMNADGTRKVNTNHLDAISDAIWAYKGEAARAAALKKLADASVVPVKTPAPVPGSISTAQPGTSPDGEAPVTEEPSQSNIPSAELTERPTASPADSSLPAFQDATPAPDTAISGSKSMLWLWITLPCVLLGGGATAFFLLRKRKGVGHEQTKDTE